MGKHLLEINMYSTYDPVVCSSLVSACSDQHLNGTFYKIYTYIITIKR